MKLIATKTDRKLYEDHGLAVIVDDEGEHRLDVSVQAVLKRGYWQEVPPVTVLSFADAMRGPDAES